jgi:hypothetical protein
MALAPKQLAQAAITAVYVTIYTVPAATVTVVQTIDICNTTAAAKLVYVHLVPSGGAAGTDNALMYMMTVAAYSTCTWQGPQTLDTVGDFISVKADDVGLTVTISGLELT